jgi:ankyrin repeat protein
MLVKLSSLNSTDSKVNESAGSSLKSLQIQCNRIQSSEKVTLVNLLTSKDASGKFPLHFVAKIDDQQKALDVATWILNNRGNNPLPSWGDQDSLTPLHYAAAKGHQELCTLMSKHGANINGGDKDGVTPFHVACYYGHVEAAKALVQAGASIWQGNEIVGNPLHYAVIGGDHNLPMVQFLMESGISPAVGNSLAITPFHLAAKNNLPQIIELLASKLRVLNIEDIFNNSVPDEDWYGSVYQGDKSGVTALILSVKEENLETTKTLIKIGVDPRAGDNNGFSPVHIAAQNGNYNLLKLMANFELFYGENNAGSNPLHLACMNGHLNAAYFLIKQHPDHLEDKNKAGFTSLDYACSSKSVPVVALLLDKGAKITDNSLGESLKKGELAITKLLLSTRIIPTEKDLSFTVSKGSYDATKLLLECCANPAEEVLKIASQIKNNMKILELLVNYGGEITQDVANTALEEYRNYLSSNIGVSSKINEDDFHTPESESLLGLYQPLLDNDFII